MNGKLASAMPAQTYQAAPPPPPPPPRGPRHGTPSGSGPSQPPSRSERRRRKKRSAGSRILGGIGEIFITLGVLGILFLVWELWWTGLGADREREAATDELFQNLENIQESDSEGVELDGQNVPGPGNTAEFAEQGNTMAVVYAPRLGGEWAAPVLSGVGSAQLNTAGLGHYPSTQLPGEPGNFALAGHRQTYGSILWNQDKFVSGDLIYVQTPDGYYTYEVYETHIVQPNQSEVLAPVPGEPDIEETDRSVLTLTTCHPPYTTLERMVTHAELVGHTPLSEGPPEAIAPQVEERMQAVSPAEEGVASADLAALPGQDVPAEEVADEVSY